MLEVPTDSTNKELQDAFNAGVASAIESLRTDFDTYKSDIERLYELEGTNGPTDSPNWRDFMYRLFTKVKEL